MNLSYRSVTHACGHVTVHEMRGSDADKDALYLRLRGQECVACQVAARYDAPKVAA